MNSSMFGGEIVMKYKRDKEVSSCKWFNTYSSHSMSLEIVTLGNARKRIVRYQMTLTSRFVKVLQNIKSLIERTVSNISRRIYII
jgi:hypothetical protein